MTTTIQLTISDLTDILQFNLLIMYYSWLIDEQLNLWKFLFPPIYLFNPSFVDCWLVCIMFIG